jgi:hypothetical protein
VTTVAERSSWTAQGSADASKRTYDSVKAALSRSFELQGVEYEVFLQGSYANSTNTRGDSDVDVVVMLTSTFMPDTARLSPMEKQYHQIHRVPGTTTASEFRGKIERALRGYYGNARVSPKNKCIRVAKADGYVDADVVPAQQHRLYTSYSASGRSEWTEGISIQPLQGGRIVNYPKEHIRNGQAKNGAANGYYKPTVRQVKRLRRRAVDLGLLGPKDAPGYLLECLVSNVPTEYFVSDPSDRLVKIIAYLSVYNAKTLLSHMWSGDRIHKLFDDDPGEHNQYTAKRVIDVLWELL